jgi:hypothetical protein
LKYVICNTISTHPKRCTLLVLTKWVILNYAMDEDWAVEAHSSNTNDEATHEAHRGTF